MKISMRGRPCVDQSVAEERGDTIRKMREEGLTFRAIADRLSIDVSTAHRAINPRTQRMPLAANDNKVVRAVPFNGGWSTNSGMVEVSLPRVPTLDTPEVPMPCQKVADERLAA